MHHPGDQNDQRFMSRALELAERGLYSAHPNPRVGCVLVRDGDIVGEGWHRAPGEAHAEVDALARMRGSARGATAYVTLEPCCHTGRTPPCAERLIEARVSRVVAAIEDPDPRVAGRGFTLLEQAGIEVAVGVLAAQASALNAGFIRRMTLKRPAVRLKLAMSLDGRTAMACGESKWITSPPAREDVHRLRARSSAIVTGIGTALADNPSLTVRLSPQDACAMAAPVQQPLRLVLDSNLRLPADARMLTLPGRTVIATCSDDHAAAHRLEESGAEVIRLSRGRGGVSLEEALVFLADQACNEALFECGATLAGRALAEDIVDELVVFVAPRLLGHEARPLLRLEGLRSMDDHLALELVESRSVGPDLRLTLRPKLSCVSNGTVPTSRRRPESGQ